MKKKILTISFSLFLIWYGIALSDTCYRVEGEVKTMWFSETGQVGSIELQLYDEDDKQVFNGTGTLVGEMTYGVPYSYLQHTAILNDNDGNTITFATDRDKAVILDIRKVGENGAACSFEVHEEITNVVGTGTGFFEQRDISDDTKLDAFGYIDTCEGVGENEFELTGQLCFEDN